MGNVGMVECGECLRLALEAREPFGIVREHVRQNLQRDVPFQLRIARAINLAHASGANLCQDTIRAAARAGSEGHRDGILCEAMSEDQARFARDDISLASLLTSP